MISNLNNKPFYCIKNYKIKKGLKHYQLHELLHIYIYILKAKSIKSLKHLAGSSLCYDT